MPISRRAILSALGASALPVAFAAQDPQIAVMDIEGRMPLSSVLPNPGRVMPPEMITAIQSGALETRGRFEYIPASKAVRIRQLFVPPQTPFPMASPPAIHDKSVGAAVDLAAEHIYWREWKASEVGADIWALTIVGRTRNVAKAPAVAGDCGVIQIGFERQSPHKITTLSLSFAAEFVAFTTDASGVIKLGSKKSA